VSRTPAPLLLRSPSRAAGLPRPRARLALAGIAAALLLSLLALATPLSLGPAALPGTDRRTDLDLYAAIVEGVRWQGHYYLVAADALRSGSYPLRPFLAFRLPTLAMLQAMLPPFLVVALLWALALATALAWYRRLAPAFSRLSGRLAVVVLFLGGSLAAWQADLSPFHELWAGLLIALSLALQRPGRWLEPVAIGLAAAVIRETAALYLVVMTAVALAEGGRREATGWAAALGLFAIVLAVHAHAAGLVTRPLDAASPGWSGLEGPGFAVRALVTATVLLGVPMPVAAPLAALAVAGWAGWRDPVAVRVLATIGAYLVLLALFARADNFYWALMIAPIALPGLAFVPDLLRDLAAGALDRRRITVRRVVR